MTAPTIEEVNGAIKALREEVEKLAPSEEKMVKIDAVLLKNEEKNQALILGIKQAEVKAVEQQERVVALELAMATMSAATISKDYKDSPEYKALVMFSKTGEFESAEQKALLRTDSDGAGGFLIPTEMDSMIIRMITEISPIRQIARVRTIAGKQLDMPTRLTIPVATFEGEAEAGDDSASTYGSESVSPWRQTTTIPITRDMLMDSAFNMESELLTDTREAFSFSEGKAFVSGNGNRQPYGFTADLKIQEGAYSAQGTGINYTGDDLLNMMGTLKMGYNPNFVLNRRELAYLRTLKTTDGAYLWAPGLNGGAANTLAGVPYVIANDMQDRATNAYPIAYGDFTRGYTIIDRTGIDIIRDEFTQKRKAIIEFTFNRWVTGRVTLPEAITLLKIVN